MATTTQTQTQTRTRERRPSTSAPISDLKGPVGPDFTRPKHKRTATGFSAGEIKSVESSIPESQREAYVFRLLPSRMPRTCTDHCAPQLEEICEQMRSHWAMALLLTPSTSLQKSSRPRKTLRCGWGISIVQGRGLTVLQREAIRHIETTLARSLFNCDEL